MSWATVVSIVAAVCLVRGYDVQTTTDSGPWLPGDTEPRSYALRIEPNVDAENATFAGRVDITIAVVTTTSTITLNSKDLVLHEITVTDESTDRDVGVSSWSYAEDRQQVMISMDGHVLANRRYMIRIRFEGVLRDDGTGFFKSFYETDSDGKKWIAATQFQTAQARSTFPCYDEPHFRTPFNISIKVKEYEMALSNMPVVNTIHIDDSNVLRNGTIEYRNSRKWVYFAQTPCMSTCSVAFFAGQFEQFDKTRLNAIRVYSHLGRLYQVESMTKAVPDILRAMENYTGIAYPLPELNLLAMPVLGSGQLDNWGLTTYREKTLFIDSKTNSKTIVSAKTAVGHSVANQWFGNLVTPARWDCAWLSKGLATYLEYFVTATVEPEWRLDHFFVIDQQRPAMDNDKNQSQPLTAPAIMPGDVDYYSADQLSGQKAASIMMMLNDWVGEKVFKRAINAYLTHNQFSAVKPEQLWNAFDNALFDLTKSGLNDNNVGTVMKTWTEQTGYPVVNVKKKDKSLILTQQRFLSGFNDVNDTSKWFIRLSYTTNKEKNFDTKSAPTVWLNPSVNETVIPIDDDVEWYIFNIQSTGFYRVNYTEDNWLSLVKQLNDSPKDVHVLNRVQLIDDSFSLAKAGLLNYKIPMSFTEYLEKEDDIMPWFSAMNSLNYVLNRMRRFEIAYTDVKATVFNLASTAFEMIRKVVAGQKSPQNPTNIGWNTFSTWASRLDENLLYRDTTVSEYFRRWNNGEEIPADIKEAAFCFGVQQYYTSNLDKFLLVYNTTKTYSERASVINALPCADIQTLLTYLTLIMDDQCPIEPSDYEDFFNALSSTTNGLTAMSYFLGKQFTDIVNNVKNGRNIAMTIYSILASKASTESEIENIMKMALKSNAPDEYRNNKILPVYQRETEEREKWYKNGSPEAIWAYLTKGLPLYELDKNTTPQSASKDDSSASSRLHNYAIILQILALSVSVKLLVHVI